ncbi:MCE family protein [Nocardia sp. NPDC059764]|uniref:MCE family protein n=1 Tax=Nocardia sp. NPDC059764 TaxID=3346939 RepID=UPI00364F39F2
MKLSRFVKIQLAIFTVLTVIGITVMGGEYVKLPAMFGIGRYDVTVKLAATGGLYENANVAYRGTNVGKVNSVVLTPQGVNAKLSIDSDFKIPSDVDAWVKSVSAIGEQYVDLVPKDNPQGGNLRDGSVIPVERTKLPMDIGGILDRTDRLLSSVADTRLQQVIEDAFVAFNGAGPDLERLLDSASLLVQEAKTNTDATKDLIDKIGPLLDTQIESDSAMRGWTKDLATVTDQLREHDPALRNVIDNGPGALNKATKLFEDLKPTVPLLAQNLVSLGQVGVTYRASVEQLLVVFPPLIGALMTLAKGSPTEYGGKVDFKIGLNDPKGCVNGFLAPEDRRSPNDYKGPTPETPKGLYCKIPQNSQDVVRGVRNNPCMDVPGKRAATVEQCHDPEGYQPAGDNPAFGKPNPVDNNGKPIFTPSSLGNGGEPGVAPASVTTRTYDPKSGTYLGPDGVLTRQADIGPDGSGIVPANWQTMLQEQQR